MELRIQKWGKSAALRLPALVMAEAKLDIDSKVDVRVEGGRIVVEPLAPADLGLSSLLAGITTENLHDEVPFGGSLGKELL